MSDEDWRLKVQLATAVDDGGGGGALDHLLGHLRGRHPAEPELVHELGDVGPAGY